VLTSETNRKESLQGKRVVKTLITLIFTILYLGFSSNGVAQSGEFRPINPRAGELVMLLKVQEEGGISGSVAVRYRLRGRDRVRFKYGDTLETLTLRVSAKGRTPFTNARGNPVYPAAEVLSCFDATDRSNCIRKGSSRRAILQTILDTGGYLTDIEFHAQLFDYNDWFLDGNGNRLHTGEHYPPGRLRSTDPRAPFIGINTEFLATLISSGDTDTPMNSPELFQSDRQNTPWFTDGEGGLYETAGADAGITAVQGNSNNWNWSALLTPTGSFKIERARSSLGSSTEVSVGRFLSNDGNRTVELVQMIVRNISDAYLVK